MAKAATPAAAPPPLKAEDLIVLQRDVGQAHRTIPPMLERELFRQAMLIAARDGQGLWTRDAALNETTPPGLGDLSARTVTVQVDMDYPQTTLLVSVRTLGAAHNIAFQTAPTMIEEKCPDIMPLIVRAEVASREDFAKWLVQGGLTGTGPAKAGNGTIDADEEARLGRLTIFSQYEAVAVAHDAIRRQGESVDLLGAMVRGYANLGQLTRMHWTAASDVFAARSLIYAQRIVQENPSSPTALWHRAYALAMAGLHKSALEDLTAAGDAQDGPGWAVLIDPLCNYQPQKLHDLAAKDPNYAELANFMAFLDCENCDSQSVAIEAGKAVLALDPNCERVIDGMTEAAGVSYGSQLTETCFTATVQTFRGELPHAVNLPANVHQAWDAAHTNPDLMQDVADVSRAFVDAPDTNEPSWSALGRLLQESNFVHVYRRAYFIGNYWGSSVTDFANSAAPLIKGHPYAPLIAAIDAEQQRIALPAEVKNIEFVDQSFRNCCNMRFWWMLESVRNDFSAYWGYEFKHLNPTAWDLECALRKDSMGTGELAPCGRMLQVVSPRSAVAPAAMIRSGLAEPLSHLPEWATQYKGEVAFDIAAAEHFYDKKEYARAIPFYRDYLKTATDSSAFQHLADCYLKLGNEATWLSTLQTSLQKEDYALDHAWVQSTIADHYMKQKKFQDAQPYEDAAATSGAAWALDGAAECHLSLREYDAAATYAQQSCESYRGPAVYWYSICRSTDHGDLAAARAAMQRWLPTSEDYRAAATFYLTEGQPDKAIETLKSKSHAEAYNLLWLAQMYDTAGDAAQRDESLKKLQDVILTEKQAKSDDKQAMQLGALIQAALAKPAGTLDLKAYAAIHDPMPASKGAPLDYFVAKFLEKHGDAKTATVYLKRCARDAEINSTAGRLSRFELHDQGIDPYDLK